MSGVSSSSSDSCHLEVLSVCGATIDVDGDADTARRDMSEIIDVDVDVDDDDDDDDDDGSVESSSSIPTQIVANQNDHNNANSSIAVKDTEEDSAEEIMMPTNNLANLVAATIRDRVVLEQMEELRLLKAQLLATQRVEITGPNGFPVYARGNFAFGDFNATSLQSLESDNDAAAAHSLEEGDGGGASSSVNIDENGLFWDVGLETLPVTGNNGSSSSNIDESCNKSKPMIPLNKLSNIEIRIGGTLYTTSTEVEGTSMAFGIRPGNKFDLQNGKRDMSRSAVAEFNTEDNLGSSAGGRAALLTFHMPNFDRGHWRSLQSVTMLNRSIALRQQEREEEREERREIREVERRERIEGQQGDMIVADENGDESDYESDYDDDEEDEEDQEDPLDVYNYLTLCLSKRHPEQRADITSVSFCVKSVRGRIENLVHQRGEDFEATKRQVFGKIDSLYQEEGSDGGVESLEEDFATLNNDV